MTESPDTAAIAAGLRARVGDEPIEVLVTLGSGLGAVADALTDDVAVSASQVEGLPRSSVPGHDSLLRVGRLGGRRVLVQQGRAHLYEGHGAADVTRVVDVAAAMGARTFVVTNAAGGLVPTFEAGDVMVIRDHLNLTGTSPLMGLVVDGAPVFQDMADAYDTALIALFDVVAADLGLTLCHGVYAGLLGPAYETAAEVAMLRTLGADAVGMSTVLEVIAARRHGMRVAGLSTITNVHGPGVATSHVEVVEVGARVRDSVARLIVSFLEHLPG